MDVNFSIYLFMDVYHYNRYRCDSIVFPVLREKRTIIVI